MTDSVAGLWTTILPSYDGSMGAIVSFDGHGNILGGDRNFFYAGAYEVLGSKITARLKITHYHGSDETMWGTKESSFEVAVTGIINGNVINGQMSRGTEGASVTLTRRT